MKHFVVVCVFLLMLCGGTLCAQDIIIKQNKEEIQVKILTVSEESVTYRKYVNQDGPTYTMAISDIFMIKYQTGEKVLFTTQQVKKENTESKQKEMIAQSYKKKNAQRLEQLNKRMPQQQLKIKFMPGLGFTSFADKDWI